MIHLHYRYITVYSYAPQDEDELELEVGDVVSVMEQCDDGWYVGSNQRTGQFGPSLATMYKGSTV